MKLMCGKGALVQEVAVVKLCQELKFVEFKGNLTPVVMCLKVVI